MNDSVNDVRLHKKSAVGDGAVSKSQLEGCDGHFIADGYLSDGDSAPVVRRLEDALRLSGEGDARQRAEAVLPAGGVKIPRTDPLSNLDCRSRRCRCRS